MYLTYDEYIGMGGELSEAAFFRLEFKARMMIPAYVRTRIETVTPPVENVKRLMWELISKTQTIESTENIDGGGVTASESNDGVSVSFDHQNITSESLGKSCALLMDEYLGGCCTPDGVPYTCLGVHYRC